MVALFASDGAGVSMAVERLQHAIPSPTHGLDMGLHSQRRLVPAIPLAGVRFSDSPPAPMERETMDGITDGTGRS
jgi:hypothetical protein